jgi:arsenite/tail-anchored protein-transporting ATPase
MRCSASRWETIHRDPGLPTLFAMNLDPEKSAAEYRERMVGPYRGLLPEAAVKSMEEQFSGSCTLRDRCLR